MRLGMRLSIRCPTQAKPQHVTLASCTADLSILYVLSIDCVNLYLVSWNASSSITPCIVDFCILATAKLLKLNHSM